VSLDTPEARRAFIRAKTVPSAPPLVPEVRLFLAERLTPLWYATADELEDQAIAPPYWAFAWPGGQALARYVLDRPDLVRGRAVLDLAAGSGLVGMAAALAGASAVTCSEIDPLGTEAIRLNAALNGVGARVQVRTDDLTAAPPGAWSLILAGDIWYEQPMAEVMTGWLRRAAAGGAVVLAADPGRAHVPSAGLTTRARVSVPTTREVEDADQRETTIYRIHDRTD
jgi:predicted nicotinamide N-methyase